MQQFPQAPFSRSRRSLSRSTPSPFSHTWVCGTHRFRERFSLALTAFSKERGLSQPALAGRNGGHVQQLKRYEAGSSQPSLVAIRNLAAALSVISDQLLFGTDERGPDGDLRLQFAAIMQFDEEENHVVRSVLEGMIRKQEARRWQSVFAGAVAGNRGAAAGRK